MWNFVIPDRNWMTRTVTIFKADCSSSGSLCQSANQEVRQTVGSVYTCQVSIYFYGIVSQFHLCEYTQTKLLSFGIRFFFSFFFFMAQLITFLLWHQMTTWMMTSIQF